MRTRKVLIWVSSVAAVMVVGAFALLPGYLDARLNPVVSAPVVSPSDIAQRLHRNLFVADLHSDFLLWSRDPLTRANRGHTDLPRLVEGNVALQVFSTVTKSPRGQNYEANRGDTDNITPLAVLQLWPPSTWRSLAARALYQARRLVEASARSGGRLSVIRTASDLDRFVQQRSTNPGMIAGLLSTEGLQALDGNLQNVERLFEAGFRMFGLTHFFDNEIAGSAHGIGKGGLTQLGRQVLRRMEELQILVDLAHASPRTIQEVLGMTHRPVVISHTGVQGTCPGTRNLSDEQLRGIAATGGVIGIGYWDGAVCTIGAASTARAIRHAVDVVGVNHVALGSDFDGTTRMPFDTSGLVQVTQALLDQGFNPEQIALIMGGNVLRLLRETLPQR